MPPNQFCPRGTQRCHTELPPFPHNHLASHCSNDSLPTPPSTSSFSSLWYYLLQLNDGAPHPWVRCCLRLMVVAAAAPAYLLSRRRRPPPIPLRWWGLQFQTKLVDLHHIAAPPRRQRRKKRQWIVKVYRNTAKNITFSWELVLVAILLGRLPQEAPPPPISCSSAGETYIIEIKPVGICCKLLIMAEKAGCCVVGNGRHVVVSSEMDCLKKLFSGVVHTVFLKKNDGFHA